MLESRGPFSVGSVGVRNSSLGFNFDPTTTGGLFNFSPPVTYLTFLACMPEKAPCRLGREYRVQQESTQLLFGVVIRATFRHDKHQFALHPLCSLELLTFLVLQPCLSLVP